MLIYIDKGSSLYLLKLIKVLIILILSVKVLIYSNLY